MQGEPAEEHNQQHATNLLGSARPNLNLKHNIVSQN